MSATIILLFSGFVLADTAKLIDKSKYLGCDTHSCVNYPKNATSLLLDYMNIFVNMSNYK
jgi:FtsH-binding integral membrane protein